MSVSAETEKNNPSKSPFNVMGEIALTYEGQCGGLISAADLEIEEKTHLLEVSGSLQQRITSAFQSGLEEINFNDPTLRSAVDEFKKAFPELAHLFESGKLKKEDASAFKDALSIEDRKLQQMIEQRMIKTKYTMEDVRAVMDIIRKGMEGLDRAIQRWLDRTKVTS